MKNLTFSSIVLAFCASGAFAQTTHGMDHSGMHMSESQIEGAVHATAVLNAISEGSANVSHDPIPEIGWPGMTMDLPLQAGAQIMGDVAPGDKVTLMLFKGADRMYAIGAIMPN
ncbi:copper-binding protein [Leisingera daeponensis]|uniref:copper-binding protein n=1 Tax=Leisingera daeponensis TaxID=405746 RepID=UPI001C938A89|nr:copper-binding protein [Leisingera daeponensis]MBY6059655.1 copper-binding protein [Leisingera daeponensis]